MELFFVRMTVGFGVIVAALLVFMLLVVMNIEVADLLRGVGVTRYEYVLAAILMAAAGWACYMIGAEFVAGPR